MDTFSVSWVFVMSILSICLLMTTRYDLLTIKVESLPKDSPERRELIKGIHFTGKKIELVIASIFSIIVVFQVIILIANFMSNNAKPQYIKDIEQNNITISNLFDKECKNTQCESIGSPTEYIENGLPIEQYFARKVNFLRNSASSEDSKNAVLRYDELKGKIDRIDSLSRIVYVNLAIILILTIIERSVKIYRLIVETRYI